jgi:hypothetical protein
MVYAFLPRFLVQTNRHMPANLAEFLNCVGALVHLQLGAVSVFCFDAHNSYLNAHAHPGIRLSVFENPGFRGQQVKLEVIVNSKEKKTAHDAS